MPQLVSTIDYNMAHQVNFFTLISFLFVFCSLNQAEVYHITTNSSELCTLPCLTLFQFAANSSNYLHPNTTLVFFPGTHNLMGDLTVSNLSYFSMTSENSTVAIVCDSYSLISFSHYRHVHINNLKFIGCGDNQVNHVEEFVVKNATFEGHGNSSTALKIIETAAKIINSTFKSNTKGMLRYIPLRPREYYSGGGIVATRSEINIISQSLFQNNAASYGGAIFAEKNSIIRICNSRFINNTTTNHGGALLSYSSTITIGTSRFDDNTATYGGVLYSHRNSITIGGNEMERDAATCHNNLNYNLRSRSNFTNNNSTIGAVLYIEYSSTINLHGSLLIANNSATSYAVIHLTDSVLHLTYSGNSTFLKNVGSLMAFNSNITLMGYIEFVHNLQPQRSLSPDNFQEGGAITLFQSIVLFDGMCSLQNNQAENGGALLSTESKLYINGKVTIAYNTATRNGRGVYLSNSELNCNGKVALYFLLTMQDIKEEHCMPLAPLSRLLQHLILICIQGQH